MSSTRPSVWVISNVNSNQSMAHPAPVIFGVFDSRVDATKHLIGVLEASMKRARELFNVSPLNINPISQTLYEERETLVSELKKSLTKQQGYQVKYHAGSLVYYITPHTYFTQEIGL